jgi:hypothetical protein
MRFSGTLMQEKYERTNFDRAMSVAANPYGRTVWNRDARVDSAERPAPNRAEWNDAISLAVKL